MSRLSPPRSPSDEDYERRKLLEKRRREWLKMQEKEREHERLKKKKIEEYERMRAEKLKQESEYLKRREHGHRSRSSSSSRSKSQERHRRNYSKATSSGTTQVMSEKLNSSEGNKPFFKGPEETMKIKERELREITVQITRKIHAPATETTEIRRDIVNPEDITLKRREGEGAKPLFDREELKHSENWTNEIEERKILTAGKSTTAKKPPVKQRSISLSPRRHRSPSPQSRSSERSHKSRRDEHSSRRSEDRYKERRSSRDYSHSRDRNRGDSRRRRERSYSNERSSRRSDRDYSRSSRSEKEYREYRGRSKSYDRHDRLRDSSMDHRLSSTFGDPAQVPYVLIGGYAPPRPLFVGPPMPPIRGPLVRGPFPPPLAPMGHFRPRPMGPQNVFRPVLPPDSRYGRM